MNGAVSSRDLGIVWVYWGDGLTSPQEFFCAHIAQVSFSNVDILETSLMAIALIVITWLRDCWSLIIEDRKSSRATHYRTSPWCPHTKALSAAWRRSRRHWAREIALVTQKRITKSIWQATVHLVDWVVVKKDLKTVACITCAACVACVSD